MYHNEKSIMVHDMQSAHSPEWSFKTLELWRDISQVTSVSNYSGFTFRGTDPWPLSSVFGH